MAYPLATRKPLQQVQHSLLQEISLPTSYRSQWIQTDRATYLKLSDSCLLYQMTCRQFLWSDSQTTLVSPPNLSIGTALILTEPINLLLNTLHQAVAQTVDDVGGILWLEALLRKKNNVTEYSIQRHVNHFTLPWHTCDWNNVIFLTLKNTKECTIRHTLNHLTWSRISYGWAWIHFKRITNKERNVWVCKLLISSQQNNIITSTCTTLSSLLQLACMHILVSFKVQCFSRRSIWLNGPPFPRSLFASSALDILLLVSSQQWALSWVRPQAKYCTYMIIIIFVRKKPEHDKVS